jgi:formamidopyrimidine-DNA glycosylase
MPELPEVQTTVNNLNKKILNRKITGVWFDNPKMISIILGADKRGIIRGTTRKQKEFKRLFEKQIKKLEIKEIKRRGKNILIYLNPKSKILNPKLLLIHQKLTGHLLIGKWKLVNGNWKSLIKGLLEEKVNNYIHLIFYLDNGWQLALSDLRKFAKVLLGPKEKIEKMPDLAKLGTEPLDKSFTFEKFKETLRQARGKRKIKQVLMDQEVIAGIGNIYSDEILWKARIHPFKRTNQLTTKKLKAIYAAMREILKKAIQLRGTSTSDYRDPSGKLGKYTEKRYAYQRENKPCPRCKTPIKRIKLAGRSAHYCLKCQKL